MKIILVILILNGDDRVYYGIVTIKFYAEIINVFGVKNAYKYVQHHYVTN